jgi:hypothetical protein
MSVVTAHRRSVALAVLMVSAQACTALYGLDGLTSATTDAGSEAENAAASHPPSAGPDSSDTGPPSSAVSSDADAKADTSEDAGADRALDDGSEDAASEDGGSLGSEASAGPVLVQQSTGSALDASAATVTLPMPPASGDLLVLATADDDRIPSDVTSGSATWTMRGQSGEHVCASVWTAVAVAPNDATVTLAWGVATQAFAGTLSEWRGVSSFLGVQTASGIGGSVGPPSIDAGPGQLVFACAGIHGLDENNAASGPSAGFGALEYESTEKDWVIAGYLSPQGSGTFATQWTQNTPDGWDALIVSFGH